MRQYLIVQIPWGEVSYTNVGIPLSLTYGPGGIRGFVSLREIESREHGGSAKGVCASSGTIIREFVWTPLSVYARRYGALGSSHLFLNPSEDSVVAPFGLGSSLPCFCRV
jgi:hypothetical protein